MEKILDMQVVIVTKQFSNVVLSKARFPLPELTARVDGWPVSITRQHGPCWRAGVSTSLVDGPCWWPVNSASGNRA